MNPGTESGSRHNDLEKLSAYELVSGIHSEDMRIAVLVEEHLDKVAELVDVIYEKLRNGGRLFYLGAGTSGRLGVLDASECPPTFGVPHEMVIGIIAGGDGAIRKAVEFAEDDTEQGFRDLKAWHVDPRDVVVGISASGRTPYVLGALEACRAAGITTGCIVCNDLSPIAGMADHPIAISTGPEFVTGSTRMKAGTATKMVLNMLTTGAMIRLGRVKGNRMVDMQLSNNKLIERGTKMVMEETGCTEEEARKLLLEKGSVRTAVEYYMQEKK